MYPDYFAKRAQWKKLQQESWEREVSACSVQRAVSLLHKNSVWHRCALRKITECLLQSQVDSSVLEPLLVWNNLKCLHICYSFWRVVKGIWSLSWTCSLVSFTESCYSSFVKKKKKSKVGWKKTNNKKGPLLLLWSSDTLWLRLWKCFAAVVISWALRLISGHPKLRVGWEKLVFLEQFFDSVGLYWMWHSEQNWHRDSQHLCCFRKWVLKACEGLSVTCRNRNLLLTAQKLRLDLELSVSFQSSTIQPVW